MTSRFRFWAPAVGLLAIVASATPASAQISAGAQIIAIPGYVGSPMEHYVAFDTQNQVYLDILGSADPVVGQFIDKNGAKVGGLFTIAGEGDLTGWGTVTFGGTTSDPAFLVTYLSWSGTFTKFGRLIRYQGGAPMISAPIKITTIGGEWNNSEFSRSTWDGQQFIISTRLPYPGLNTTVVQHMDLNGVVSGGQDLGDGLDAEGLSDIACNTTAGICMVFGMSWGVPNQGKGDAWGRVFDARTLAPISGLFYLDDTSRGVPQEDIRVAFNAHNGKFQTAWVRRTEGGPMDFRLVGMDGTATPLDMNRAFGAGLAGAGTGSHDLSYSSATQTVLMPTQWAPASVNGTAVDCSPYYGNMTALAKSVCGALFALELGDDGYPINRSNVPLLRPWDGLTPGWWSSVAVDVGNARWLVVGSLQGTCCGSVATIVQGTASGQSLSVTIAGSGSVASVPSGISCSSGTCSSTFTPGATVTLTATASSSTFTGWSGACSGTSTCTVTMSAAASVTATFSNTVAPTITTQPQSQRIRSGQGATMSVVATGTPAPIYQWQVSTNGGSTFSNMATGAPYSGVTTPTLIISGANFNFSLSGTQYRLLVTNSIAQVASQAATLSVTPVPQDFNGDGFPDLVFRNAVTGANQVWLMNGATLLGTVVLPPVSDPNWRLVATVDLNGDGYPDLIWRNVVTGANQVWLMNGTTVASSIVLPSVPDVTWELVGAADLDGDGHADLIWRNRVTGNDTVWYMNGTTVLSIAALPSVADVTWQLVAVGDLDGDGHPDFVWRNAATGDDAAWFMNNRTISSIVSLPKVPDANWQIVDAVDLDGDGHADLIWHDTFFGDTAFWYMNGATQLSVVSAPRQSDTTWAIAGQTVRAPSDFNLDGHPELVWRNYATGDNALWNMSNTTLLTVTGLPSLADVNWHIVATADLNGDGWPDLIWRNAVTGQNMAWFMNGTAVAAVVTLPSVPDTTWDLVAAADLDGDGHPDFLWHNRVTCANAIWYMQDGATIKSAGIVALPTVGDPNWHLVAAADLDGDGHPDLIWRNVVTGENAVWHMNNATILSIAMLPTVGDTNYDLVGAFDVNGDGKPDLVWRNRVTGGNVVWYLNDVFVTGAAALPAFAADFNWRLGR